MGRRSTHTVTVSPDTGRRENWSAQHVPLPAPAPRGSFELIGRYGLCEQISCGGMAAVHLGVLFSTNGFSRFVAIKRMHPQLSTDANFVARFKDEVMLGALISHPNVVQTLDVVASEGQLLLVMEYVHGETLAELSKAATLAGKPLSIDVGLNIISSALHGLHAAHEAVDGDGSSLSLVHRDFSPQNVLVSSDGHVRVLDFGIAKSVTQSAITRVGETSGKLAYMAPEQLLGVSLDRRTDIFAAGVVLWEVLAGRRLFGVSERGAPSTLLELLERPLPSPRLFRPEITVAVEVAVLRALSRDPEQRYATAREFALALEATGLLACSSAVATSVQSLCAARLNELSELKARAARAVSLVQKRHLLGDSPTENAREASSSAVREICQAAQSEEPIATLPAPGSGSRARGVWHGFLAVAVATAIAVASATAVLRLRSAELSGVSQPLPSAGSLSETTPGGINALEPAATTGAPAVEAVAPLYESRAKAPAQPDLNPAQPVRKGAVLSVARATAPARNASDAMATTDCSPPTYLDERGIRVFKEGCL